VSTGWRSGAWRGLGARELFEELRDELERAEHAARGPRRLGGLAVYFKGSPLRPRPALRHALRRWSGLAEIPRLQEFANLSWLRAHGFLAARPLCAGVCARAGLPRYQFLCTEFVPDAPDLAELFPRAAPARRAALLEALALDVARLHALGFVHRDLFPRNLLACATPAGERCLFLDAWRGGARRGLRGPDHDLGCLFLDGASLFTEPEQARFLTSYREESARQGRNLPRAWLEGVRKARASVWRREVRRRPELAPDWKKPSLG